MQLCLKQFFRTRIQKDSREKIFRLPGHMMRHMKKRSAIQTEPSDELADRRIVIITFRQKMSDGMSYNEFFRRFEHNTELPVYLESKH